MNRLSFDQAFAAAATTAVILGVIGGFWVLGTPGRQRSIAADRQRLQDLGMVAQNLHQNYLNQPDTYQLPASLPAAESRNDPLTNQPYEYQRLSDRTFRLCANFDTDSSTYPLSRPPQDPALQRWQHPQGRHCFEFSVTEYPGVVYY
ncbi:MAG TPA: hypothetical protein IGR64_00180 [Leptolyngbyaceae cyanobacterium M65_K2018_010]|nr:hypothetical protein [Leptolyngbyaceae cyanobacterium M65_K2018_010]